jgi:multidrug efflux pump subunit AcrA (membrane-fusion protein)
MSAVVLVSCERATSSNTTTPTVASAAELSHSQREVRLTGTVEAIHSSKVIVPQTLGQGGQLTLTRLIPNGTKVQQGDVVAEFDPTQQIDNALAAKGKYEDLSHQVEQKAAQNHADQEKRISDLTQAQGDLGKAQIELQKAPVLAEIAKLENEVKAEIAREHVQSLTKSNLYHDRSDAAALRILELQRRDPGCPRCGKFPAGGDGSRILLRHCRVPGFFRRGRGSSKFIPADRRSSY